MPSHGEKDLGELLRQEYPLYRIIPQHTIKYKKRTLFVDYYIPALHIAFEYDGKQHSTFVSLFHKDHWGFQDSKYRDSLKQEWADSQGVTLVRIDHKERLDISFLRAQTKEAIDRASNGSRSSDQQSQGTISHHHPTQNS